MNTLAVARRVQGYGSWQGIKQRCLKPNTVNYPRYGGKGIVVCAGIATSFQYFLSVVGTRPSLEHSIDRIDNASGYTCGVCQECLINNWKMNIRWATAVEQANNRTYSPHNKRSGYTFRKKHFLNKGIYKTAFNKYRVRIWMNGKYRNLGSYSRITEARAVRDNMLANIN